jgi:hypothetical protein
MPVPWPAKEMIKIAAKRGVRRERLEARAYSLGGPTERNPREGGRENHREVSDRPRCGKAHGCARTGRQRAEESCAAGPAQSAGRLDRAHQRLAQRIAAGRALSRLRRHRSRRGRSSARTPPRWSPICKSCSELLSPSRSHLRHQPDGRPLEVVALERFAVAQSA